MQHPRASVLVLFISNACCRFCRERCDYSFPNLKKRVPEALSLVPLASIRRFFRLGERFRDIYMKGMTGRLAHFAAKKYTSHRRIPDSAIGDLMTEFENKKQK